ncbi:MAG: hypothetical protein HFJ02_04890 [Bacilli bacterium]|nr:hypothetical protein [Bacilli bacterium]
MEIEKIVLEDNKEYFIIDTLMIDQVKYVFLSENLNPHTSLIRKFSINGKEIIALNNEQEYDKALRLFTEKYKDIFC